MDRFIASRRGDVDTESGSLFGEDELPAVSPVKPSREKKADPAPPASKLAAPGSRKSVRDFEYEDSVEGIRNKYASTAQGVDGFEDSIYLPNGEEVGGVWKLVDAFSVTPSHDPFSFHQSKGFPRAAGGGSANTRDYLNEPESQRHVIDVAGEFDGRALGFDSAVVVTKDGVVISGNNRTMSSQLAARKGTDKKYVEALLKRCRSFGFTPDQVQAFEHPRVVFEIDSQDYSPEHFEKYNASDKKEQTEEARIVKYSKVVKPEVLRQIVEVYRKYQFNFGNVYANPTAIGDIMAYLVNGGVISKEAVPKFFDGNKISDSGKQFIREYTLGAVLSERVTRALYGEGMGDLKLKVIDAAPLLLENWSNGSYAVIEELNKAVEYAIAYTRDLINGTFVVPKLDREQAKGMASEDKLAYNLKAFGEWAKQGDLLETKDPVVLKLAGSLVYSGPLFRSYLEKLNSATASAAASERETEEAGNSGLFEDTSPDRHDLLEKAVASWNRRYAVKRGVLSSVVFGGGDMVSSSLIVSDIKSKIMKWTSAKPENRNAWQEAGTLFRENFGHNPQTERDAKILYKAAKRMVDTGQVFSKDQFQQLAKEELTGQGQSAQPGQGSPAGGVPSDSPVKLFEAIKALYESGKVSKDQLVKAFQTVVSSFRRLGSAESSGVFRVMSPALKENWDTVQSFVSRLRGSGVTGRRDVVSSLRQAFGSWVTPELADEAFRCYSALSGVGEGSACRFRPLTSSQRKVIQSGLVVGSLVKYNPLSLSKSDPSFLVSERLRFSGLVGKVRSVRSEVYNVEMPGGEVVSAVEPELEMVESARPPSNDPLRETVREFLSNVSALTSVPDDQLGIKKEVLESDHVVYMHTETLPNGKPYTVEFHVVPGELAADVYVVRDFDNHPLEEDGFTIEDLEDWNLSEVDRVDGLFSKEMARTGAEGRVAAGGSAEPDFDSWAGNMGMASAGLCRPSLMDMAICSGVYRAVCQPKFGVGPRGVFGGGGVSRPIRSGPGGGSEVLSLDDASIPSGVRAFLNSDSGSADVKKKHFRPIGSQLPVWVESKLVPYGHGGAGLQVGVTSWVGKKLYHGFRGGYFDAKSYDPKYRPPDNDGGEGMMGFWATPSFSLAKKFGTKGGVVECYLDVKKALTFNKDAVAWIKGEQFREVLDLAGVDYAWMKDAWALADQHSYNELFDLDHHGKPLRGVHQLYPMIDQFWVAIKKAGYDGICLPEHSIPTVTPMDFSQVTYGKRVKAGVDIQNWDPYDVSPIDPAKVSPSKSVGNNGPVPLVRPKVDNYPPVDPKQAVPKLQHSQPVVPKQASVKPVDPKQVSVKPAVPKSISPRFKQGELF
jgi:hypothetical protein